MTLLLINANSLHIPLADQSVHCVVTSPPYYGLRDYGIDNQIGLESTPEQYVSNMVFVMREVWRVLRDDGTLWLNLGDSYNGSGGAGGDYAEGGLKEGQPKYPGRNISGLKPKDLIGIPWMVAFALRADGWYLRSDIIWHKPNPMPESVTDRPTKSHEYLFLLTKSKRCFYDADAVKEEYTKPLDRWGGVKLVANGKSTYDEGTGQKRYRDRNMRPDPAGRNRRTVWTIATAPYSGAHFATYPPALVEPCVKAGTSEHGVCPVCGAPWVRVVERVGEYTTQWGRNYSDKRMVLQGVSRNDVSKEKMMIGINNTTGWCQTCDCPDHDPIPAVVFDPFAGSGTTLMVARQLGRHGVGCDLSYTYLHDQARERLQIGALDAWKNGNGKAGGMLADLPLFGEQ